MDSAEGTDWKIAYSRLALRWNKEGASPQTAGVQRRLSTAGKGWEKARGAAGSFCRTEGRPRIQGGEVVQEGEAGEADGKKKGRPLVSPRNYLLWSRNAQGKLSAVSRGGGVCVCVCVIGVCVM